MLESTKLEFIRRSQAAQRAAVSRAKTEAVARVIRPVKVPVEALTSKIPLPKPMTPTTQEMEIIQDLLKENQRQEPVMKTPQVMAAEMQAELFPEEEMIFQPMTSATIPQPDLSQIPTEAERLASANYKWRQLKRCLENGSAITMTPEKQQKFQEMIRAKAQEIKALDPMWTDEYSTRQSLKQVADLEEQVESIMSPPIESLLFQPWTTILKAVWEWTMGFINYLIAPIKNYEREMKCTAQMSSGEEFLQAVKARQNASFHVEPKVNSQLQEESPCPVILKASDQEEKNQRLLGMIDKMNEDALRKAMEMTELKQELLSYKGPVVSMSPEEQKFYKTQTLEALRAIWVSIQELGEREKFHPNRTIQLIEMVRVLLERTESATQALSLMIEMEERAESLMRQNQILSSKQTEISSERDELLEKAKIISIERDTLSTVIRIFASKGEIDPTIEVPQIRSSQALSDFDKSRLKKTADDYDQQMSMSMDVNETRH